MSRSVLIPRPVSEKINESGIMPAKELKFIQGENDEIWEKIALAMERVDIENKLNEERDEERAEEDRLRLEKLEEENERERIEEENESQESQEDSYDYEEESEESEVCDEEFMGAEKAEELLEKKKKEIDERTGLKRDSSENYWVRRCDALMEESNKWKLQFQHQKEFNDRKDEKIQNLINKEKQLEEEQKKLEKELKLSEEKHIAKKIQENNWTSFRYVFEKLKGNSPMIAYTDYVPSDRNHTTDTDLKYQGKDHKTDLVFHALIGSRYYIEEEIKRVYDELNERLKKLEK